MEIITSLGDFERLFYFIHEIAENLQPREDYIKVKKEICYNK